MSDQGHHRSHPSLTLGRGGSIPTRKPRKTEEGARMIKILIARGLSDIEIARKMFPRVVMTNSGARYYR